MNKILLLTIYFYEGSFVQVFTTLPMWCGQFPLVRQQKGSFRILKRDDVGTMGGEGMLHSYYHLQTVLD